MTPAEQTSVLKGTIWTLVVGGPIMSYWIYHDLSALESGAKKSVSVWGPAATLYESLGFWPAVLCLPALCLVGIGVASYRLEKAKSALPAEEP